MSSTDTSNENTRKNKNFLATVGESTYLELLCEAKAKDVSVQELLRVEIIPAWMKARHAELTKERKNNES